MRVCVRGGGGGGGGKMTKKVLITFKQLQFLRYGVCTVSRFWGQVKGYLMLKGFLSVLAEKIP